MNELELAEFVDEVAKGWQQEGNGETLMVATNVTTPREADLATLELQRRGLPITVWAVSIEDDGTVEVLS